MKQQAKLKKIFQKSSWTAVLLMSFASSSVYANTNPSCEEILQRQIETIKTANEENDSKGYLLGGAVSLATAGFTSTKGNSPAKSMIAGVGAGVVANYFYNAANDQASYEQENLLRLIKDARLGQGENLSLFMSRYYPDSVNNPEAWAYVSQKILELNESGLLCSNGQVPNDSRMIMLLNSN